jgi:hypothetical protein
MRQAGSTTQAGWPISSVLVLDTMVPDLTVTGVRCDARSLAVYGTTCMVLTFKKSDAEVAGGGVAAG